MSLQIFLNVRPYQTRIACAEGGNLKDIFYHRAGAPTLTGSFYKGKVVRIMKSLNFAFIDLGLEQGGFLYGKDLIGGRTVDRALRLGSYVLAQVKTDPARGKGARLTMNAGLPGAYLVYMPASPGKISISRKIQSEEERARLTKILRGFNGPGDLIARTFARDQSRESLKKDLDSLKAEWRSIRQKFEGMRGPGEIQKGEDPVLSYLKDALHANVEALFIDEGAAYSKITKWLRERRPDWLPRARRYTGAKPLFEAFQLESQIHRARQRKVTLKNGGSLVFEELEAFTVIDVNSGSYKGRRGTEDTILAINKEAAREIARQIRLRHLGGIILVDFIDMKNPENGKKTVACLRDGFRDDRNFARIFPMSDLGLVQITRKRSRPSLAHFMTDVCPSCDGAGRTKTPAAVAEEIFLKLESMQSPVKVKFFRKKKRFQVSCRAEVKSWIEEKEKSSLEFLNSQLFIYPVFKASSDPSADSFSIAPL